QEAEMREEVEAERRRTERVAAVGALIAESLDVADTAERAARVAVPEIASFCAIDLLDAHGHVRRVAATNGHAGEGPPLDPFAPRGSALVVRTGKAEIVSSPLPPDIVALAGDPASIDPLRRLVRSYACLPLRAHGRTIGAITFTRSGANPFTPDDLTVA